VKQIKADPYKAKIMHAKTATALQNQIDKFSATVTVDCVSRHTRFDKYTAFIRYKEGVKK